MPFVRAGALVVHYELTGRPDRPTVMFANSLGTNFHIWDPQASALASRFRILRYDMRGHGLTEVGAPPYSIVQLADDALALLDVLKIETVNFCGLSVGGMVGQCLAAAAPERVASLVLCDTANRIGPPELWDARIDAVRTGGMESIASAVLSRWFTPRFLNERPDETRGYAAMLTRTPAEGYAGCCVAIRDADLGADDAKIRCPVLVVVGDQDLATPPASARALCEAIAGASLEILEGAAHIPTVERPEELNRLLAGFLQDQSESPRAKAAGRT